MMPAKRDEMDFSKALERSFLPQGHIFSILCGIGSFFASAPLAFVASSPSARLSLELRSGGCVLPGSVTFEHRVSRCPHSVRHNSCARRHNSPPLEAMQHVTSQRATAAVRHALWWVRRSPLPVALSLYFFDASDAGDVVSLLQQPQRAVLRELTLHGQQVTDVASFLPHCGEVRALALCNTHVASEKLNELARSCPHVECLSLCMSSAISGTDFLQHRSLRTLRELDLSYTNVSEESVSRDVATLRGLTRLSLEGCRVIESLHWIQSLTQLRELNLSYSGVGDESLAALQRCHGLVKLDLQCCGRVTSLAGLAGTVREGLRELNLSETSATDEGIAPLQYFLHLESLSLEGCGGVSDVNVLGSLTRLRVVDVSRTRVTNDGVASLTHCTALRIVRMRQCYRLTDVQCLSGSLQLDEVDLADCPATNEGIAPLRHARNLWKLRLQSCRTVTDVNFLSGLDRLTDLDLHHTNIDEAGSVGLVHCAHLTSLNMHSVLVESLQQWSAAAFLPCLRRLDLSNTGLTADGLCFISRCPVLEVLSLRGCKKLATVDFLFLFAPHQTSDAQSAAAEEHRKAKDAEGSDTQEQRPYAMRRLLLELTLTDTAMTDAGLRALRYCPGLRRLRLARCKKLTDVSVLRWLPQLREVDLSATEVTARGLAGLSPNGSQEGLRMHKMEGGTDDTVQGSGTDISERNEPNAYHGMRERGSASGSGSDDGTDGAEGCEAMGCVELEKLWLQSCPTLEDIRVLSGFPQLREIFLMGTPIYGKSADIDMLYRQNPSLQKVHHNLGK